MASSNDGVCTYARLSSRIKLLRPGFHTTYMSRSVSTTAPKPIFINRPAYTKGSFTDTTKTWPAFFNPGWLMYEGTCTLEQVPVKAPGTPTIYPLEDLNSSARLTLKPGEFSIKPSKLGTSSPTFTRARGVLWKARMAAAGRVKATRRREVRKAIELDLMDGLGRGGAFAGWFVVGLEQMNAVAQMATTAKLMRWRI